MKRQHTEYELNMCANYTPTELLKYLRMEKTFRKFKKNLKDKGHKNHEVTFVKKDHDKSIYEDVSKLLLVKEMKIKYTEISIYIYKNN